MRFRLASTLVTILFVGFACARMCSMSNSKIQSLLKKIKKGNLDPASGIPIPLVAPSRYGTDEPLELCAESITYLRELKDKKIAFVTIFGNARYYRVIYFLNYSCYQAHFSLYIVSWLLNHLFRAGKSTLLNHILGVKKGFDVGSDIQAVTVGAWVCKIVDFINLACCCCCSFYFTFSFVFHQFWSVPLVHNGSYVLLLDTEGLGRSSPKYDSAITLLASIISSNIIFLDSGSIRYDDVRYLQYVDEHFLFILFYFILFIYL